MIKYQYYFTTQLVYLIYIVLLRIVWAIYLKHSRLWCSADVKPIPNDLAHAM